MEVYHPSFFTQESSLNTYGRGVAPGHPIEIFRYRDLPSYVYSSTFHGCNLKLALVGISMGIGMGGKEWREPSLQAKRRAQLDSHSRSR
jgi:hypothetical protein